MTTTYHSLVPGGFFSSTPYDKSIPVSIRTNNPGAVNGAIWERDMVGYVTTDETTPGNKTTIFDAPEHGVAVWFELMRKYRAAGAITVGQIVRRYGGGQDYSAYVTFVIAKSGLSEATEIKLDDDNVLLPFAKAMFRYEAGRDTPLTEAQIKYGFELARGHTPAPAPQAATPAAPAASPLSWLATLLSALFAGRHPSSATTTPPAPAPAIRAVAAPWIGAAEKEIGFHETGENRGIEHYIALAHTGSLGDPWCAIFVNAMLESCGIPGSRSPAARSFESNANFVRLSGPAIGAITTMWRGSPPSPGQTGGPGHVFFYDGENESGILALGGNQSDQVCRQYEPRARVVGYYWPKSVALPKVGAVFVTDTEGHLVGGTEA